MLKDADPHYFAGVYIVCGYTDLRFGIDSLAAIIERRFHMHLFVPNTLFLFCGRSSTRIKGLLWEGDGFLLLYKRVESGHFTWPRSSTELRSLSAEQFHWLMQGFAIDPIIHEFLLIIVKKRLANVNPICPDFRHVSSNIHFPMKNWLPDFLTATKSFRKKFINVSTSFRKPLSWMNIMFMSMLPEIMTEQS